MININKIISLNIKSRITPFYFQRQRQLSNNRPFTNHIILYRFSKKQQQKSKRTQPPKDKAKNLTEYLSGPQNYKRNILEVKNMQTTSQAQLEEQSIRKIVISQRQLLQSSLKQQVENEQNVKSKEEQKGFKFSKILRATPPQDQAGKYFLLRPLNYLQNFIMTIFGANILGYTWLELTDSFSHLGWFFGMCTFPSACSTIPLLIGYNLGFWVARQSFYLNIPSKAIKNTEIILVSTSWKGIIQLVFISSQFAAFIYVLTFPLAFPVYKAYTGIAVLNYVSLFLNILSLGRATSLSIRSFSSAYVKLISTISMMILLFAVYEIQIIAGKTPQQSFESTSYKKRIVEIREGYEQFKSVFKNKKLTMKEDQRINIKEE